MQPAASELNWALHLSSQLVTLSELTEALTYRLLELEERLAAQDRQISGLQTASDALTTELGEAIEERMQETEDRLSRIEGLLQGGEGISPPRALRALSRSSRQVHLDPALPEDMGESDEIIEEAAFFDDVDGDRPYSDDPQSEAGLLDHSLAS